MKDFTPTYHAIRMGDKAYLQVYIDDTMYIVRECDDPNIFQEALLAFRYSEWSKLYDILTKSKTVPPPTEDQEDEGPN